MVVAPGVRILRATFGEGKGIASKSDDPGSDIVEGTRSSGHW